MQRQVLFLFLILRSLLNPTIAQKSDRVYVLHKGYSQVNIDRGVFYIEDSTNKADFFTIKQLYKSGKSNIINDRELNFGRKRYNYWMIFGLENQNPSEYGLSSLRIEEPFIDLSECYIVDAKDSLVYSGKTGRQIPTHKMSVKSRMSTFSFDLRQGNYTIYLKITNRFSNYKLRTPTTIYSDDALYSTEEQERVFYSLFLGMTVFVIVMSLMLFVFFKEKIYLFYSLTSFSMLALYLLIENYWQKIPFTDFYTNWREITIAFCMVLICYIQFSLRYLSVKRYSKSWQINFGRYLSILIAINIIALILPIEEPNWVKFLQEFDSFLALSGIFIVYVYLFNALRNRFTPAYFFIVGNFPLAIVAIIDSVVVEIVSMNVRVEKIGYYAILFEVFVLMLGIVYRFRVFAEEKTLLQKSINEQQRNNYETQLQIQERERSRIARSLHDSVGAILSSVKMNFDLMKDKKEVREDETFRNSYAMLGEAIREVRRVSHDIMPSVLVRYGLESAVKQIYEKVQKPEITIYTDGLDDRFDLQQELTVYRIVQELMSNVMRHADATEASIILIRNGNELIIKVIDNGKGFDQSHKKDGMGLENIRSRVKYLDGKLDITSTQNKGTTVVVMANVKE
ncbi:MAG: 7TM diverse intracellular signaling domain-containing protein [Spirosomataceae bacterium]